MVTVNGVSIEIPKIVGAPTHEIDVAYALELETRTD
jgi:hypothetical protein